MYWVDAPGMSSGLCEDVVPEYERSILSTTTRPPGRTSISRAERPGPRGPASVRLSRASLREARGPDRARGGAVQRRDGARRPGRGAADRDGRLLRAGARPGAGDRSRDVAAARPRDRGAGAAPLPRHPARGVPRARGDRDAAVRGQPARGPDGLPGHSRRGAVGARRDRHRHLDGRCARGCARARRAAAGRGARRLRRRRSLPRGDARPAVRRLDPARQGLPPGGRARVGHERRAPPGHPRRAAAGGRARLHRRAERQVARADRGPGAALARVLPARRLPARAGGHVAGPGHGDAARPHRAERRRAVPGRRRDGPGRRGRGPRLRVRGRGAARRAGRRLARRRCELVAGGAARGPGAVGLASLADHGRPRARESTRSSSARGTPRRPPSRRTRPRSGTRRAT